MNERTEQLKAALNTELAREGKLQRAGMRRVRLKWYRKKEGESAQHCEGWEKVSETTYEILLECKELFYFHGFVPQTEIYPNPGRIRAHAVLEGEDGRVFTWEAENIVFIT